jgi:sigma-B regulation protein RsbU (phosphoserine phosphatase)
LEQELQLAFRVQRSLMPRTTPDIPGWEFAAWWQPAREVSGDFYDFIIPSEGKHGLVIADVSDKGMHAALFMALTRSTLRAASTATGSPAESIACANRLITADSVGSMFVTLFYGEIDPATQSMTYVNCGHNPPIHYRPATHTLAELTRTGIVLGFDTAAPYQQQTFDTQPGDVLVLYTDGVTEAFNTERQLFGEERLVEIVRSEAGGSAANLIEKLQTALKDFTQETPQSDDITVVIGKRV